MNKTSSIIITTALIIGLGIVFLGGSRATNTDIASTPPAQNGEIREGVQYVSINAKGGYLPKVSTAKAGIPTKLIVKTNGTYDCSASLIIHSLKYQKILAQTGEETIDIGTPQSGQSLQGICGMGMYSFLIHFI